MPRFVLPLFILLSALQAATFREAVKALGPGDSGIAVARELATFANFLSEKLEYDEKSRRFFLFMNDALEDFDFRRIYHSEWLAPQADGFRSITLSGRNRGNRYQVSLGLEPESSALGSATAHYRMRENLKDDARTYTTQMAFSAALEKLDAQALARFAEALLRVLDPDSIASLRVPPSRVFPEIQGSMRRVLDLADAEFPHVTRFWARYLELRGFAEEREHSGKKYTEFALRGHFRLSALAQDFPQLAKYIQGIRKLFLLNLTATDRTGRKLGAFVINTFTEEFYWNFCTVGGKILPIDKAGIPAWEHALSFSGQKEHHLRVYFDFFVNVHGLKIQTGTIGISASYRSSAEKLLLFAKITQMPEGKVSGALFGVLPTWLIDLSIPSDLQTLMNKFQQTVFRANNGEGSYASLKWQKLSGRARLEANASTEFLDNRFIRIGMKIWVRKFRPNETIQEDIRRFIGALTRALLQDLAAL